MTLSSRVVLGPADVSDADLAEIVADSWGFAADDVEIMAASAEVAAYDLEALTTAGRFWVTGSARVGADERPFRFFVKHIQSFARSPIFQTVPPALQEAALALLPWQTEGLIYQSDLATCLPAGLTMPTAWRVSQLDKDSAAIWLEAVPAVAVRWDVDRYGRAAYLLGRLAASARVRALADVGVTGIARTIRGYAEGRVTHAILPALHSCELWSHPVVAATFDELLRADLLAAADNLWGVVDEIETMALGTSHGDACTRNLLVRDDSDDLTLIDFGFWGEAPLGFDLSQLLLGEVQMGERPAACLPELEGACLPAYVRGLRAEGCPVEERLVQRAHALLMLLFSGLSAIPFELLDEGPTPELHRIARERAASARFMLDLVDATAR